MDLGDNVDEKTKETYCDLLSNMIVSMFGVTKESAVDAVSKSVIQTLIRKNPDYVDHAPLSCWAEEVYNEKFVSHGTMRYKQKSILALEEIRDNYMGFFPGSIVAKCIKTIQDIPDEDVWIPVAERLPEEFVCVLVHIPEESPLPTVKEAYVVSDMWYTHLGVYPLGKVTHWMPMPEPPKEEK